MDADTAAQVWPSGCGLTGCNAHFPPGRNLVRESCICPAWFDGGGWHIISANPDCGAHQIAPVTKLEGEA